MFKLRNRQKQTKETQNNRKVFIQAENKSEIAGTISRRIVRKIKLFKW